MHFTTLDWIIVVTYLAGSMAAGLYEKKYVSGRYRDRPTFI